MEYQLINTGKQLTDLETKFYNKNITKIAVDFEGDFGTYSYGNKLCLIQIYDKHMFYIIDPLKISPDEMVKFFENKRIIKYMYGAGSDIKLVYDQYKTKVQSVYDLQLLADVLDISPKGLDKVIQNVLHINPDYNKGKYQMYNWARRPLPKDALEYALSDVKYLFDLHDTLREKINAQNLTDALIEKLIKNDYDFSLRESVPSFLKSKTFLGLSDDRKALLKVIYNIREGIAKKYDLPSTQLISNDDLYRILNDSDYINELGFNRRITENIKDEIIRQLKEKVMHRI